MFNYIATGFRYFVSVICLLIALEAFSTPMTGKEIMKKQDELHKVNSEYGEEVMLLVDGRSKSKEERIVKRYTKDMGNNLNRYLLVFLKPSDIKGTALLTHETKNDDNQWLFMPSINKLQRIAKGNKKAYFMGTDFTYEDLEPEDMNNFNYKILKSDILNRKKETFNCYVIEAKPANTEKKRYSGYSKRILWINKNNFTTLKIKFYDRRGRLLKTQEFYDIKRISGTIFRASKTIMDNHRKKHKTLTLVKKRVLNKNIKDSIFEGRFILSGRHVNQ